MSDRFLFTEGDTDRVVFEYAARGTAWRVHPQKPKPCTQSPQRAGDYEALAAAAGLVTQGVPMVAVALDLDSTSPADVFARAERCLRDRGLNLTGGNGSYTFGGTRFTVIPVGLPDDPRLRELGVTSFALDDHLLKCLLETDVYGALVGREHLQAPAHSAAIQTMRDTATTLGTHGVTVSTSKQLIDLMRAILGFRASLATLAQRVLEVGPARVIDPIVDPLAARLS